MLLSLNRVGFIARGVLASCLRLSIAAPGEPKHNGKLKCEFQVIGFALLWALIKNGQIGAGLTAEEVHLNRGKPDKVTRTVTPESRTYRAGTLIFKNGVLKKML